MKIRIRDNSIRYRLDKADIAALAAKGHVETQTRIGANTLYFCLCEKDQITEPFMLLEGSGVHLSIPLQQVRQWTGSNLTGFDAVILNPDGSLLKLLIEKDFKCLTERDEDESQAFENPLNSHTC